ncbi:MAG: ASCH domain-containing protein [Gorillibacterium sp.]|nr:ASCH domain-containing protein [Gorillibacterium sp.]
MKAITIIQPWATLIALGEKRFETRSCSTKYRGLLAIHAGKKLDREACMREPLKSVLLSHGYTSGNLPTGAVVAVVRLDECWSVSRCLRGGVVLKVDRKEVANEKLIGEQEEAFGYYHECRFGRELALVEQLWNPIPVKGMQRLWNWNDDKRD